MFISLDFLAEMPDERSIMTFISLLLQTLKATASAKTQ